MGNEADPGMMPLSMMDLFDAINASHEPSSFSVKVSYMEVYCETIRDLLSDSEKPLNPCEHPTDGTVRVLGLTEREVHDVSEVLDLVREGSERRKTEPTAANEFSSRSHAVLQVTVQKLLAMPSHNIQATAVRTSLLATSRRNSVPGRVTLLPQPEPVFRQARLSLIDLAGSERAAATLNTGTRLREGANINKSLLALANCINALSSGSERVKYRDSKLTHLLKSSLEGDCYVAMLAAVTPSHKSYEESHNTLKYAHRAKNIKSNVPPPPPAAVTAIPMSMTQGPSSTPSKSNFDSIFRPRNLPSPPPHETIPSLPRPLATVDENIPSAKKTSFFSVAGPSPTSSKRERLIGELPSTSKTEYALLVVKEERDRIAEERDELKVELQRAKETIANLKRLTASMTHSSSNNNFGSSSSSVSHIPSGYSAKPRASGAHLMATRPSGAHHMSRSIPHQGTTSKVGFGR